MGRAETKTIALICAIMDPLMTRIWISGDWCANDSCALAHQDDSSALLFDVRRRDFVV